MANQTNFQEFWSEFQPFKNSFPTERTDGNLDFREPRRKFRPYGLGFSEYQVEIFKTIELNGSNFKEERYRLRILFDWKDSIIFYNKLSRCHGYGRGAFEVEIDLSYDTIKFETYFAHHDSLYNTITVRNFSSPPFISGKFYGPICLDHSTLRFDELIAAVKSNRKDIFLEWIRSFNIEDKAYGASGLYFLKKRGEVLTEEEQMLLETTQKLRAFVNTDLGMDFLRSVLRERRLDIRYNNNFGE